MAMPKKVKKSALESEFEQLGVLSGTDLLEKCRPLAKRFLYHGKQYYPKALSFTALNKIFFIMCMHCIAYHPRLHVACNSSIKIRLTCTTVDTNTEM